LLLTAYKTSEKAMESTKTDHNHFNQTDIHGGSGITFLKWSRNSTGDL
jgi:hypothetical protein